MAATDIPISRECRRLIRRGALIAINSSGGKDSQAMTILLSRIVPREQLLVVHAPLGEVEWPGTIKHTQSTTPPAWPRTATLRPGIHFTIPVRRTCRHTPHRRPVFAAATTDSTWARERRNSRAIAAGLRPDSNAASTSRSCPGVTGAGRRRVPGSDVFPCATTSFLEEISSALRRNLPLLSHCYSLRFPIISKIGQPRLISSRQFA